MGYQQNVVILSPAPFAGAKDLNFRISADVPVEILRTANDAVLRMTVFSAIWQAAKLSLVRKSG
jgi:hypothetical protein